MTQLIRALRCSCSQLAGFVVLQAPELLVWVLRWLFALVVFRHPAGVRCWGATVVLEGPGPWVLLGHPALSPGVLLGGLSQSAKLRLGNFGWKRDRGWRRTFDSSPSTAGFTHLPSPCDSSTYLSGAGQKMIYGVDVLHGTKHGVLPHWWHWGAKTTAVCMALLVWGLL